MKFKCIALYYRSQQLAAQQRVIAFTEFTSQLELYHTIALLQLVAISVPYSYLAVFTFDMQDLASVREGSTRLNHSRFSRQLSPRSLATATPKNGRRSQKEVSSNLSIIAALSFQFSFEQKCNSRKLQKWQYY